MEQKPTLNGWDDTHSYMISIIIPAYNVQEYLQECLESILAQSYKDIEVIVVNDGSTDGTRTLAEKFVAADRRVTLINQENAGLSVARNTGINNTSGEFLMFVDSDDCLMPGAIQTLFDTLQATDADIAIGAYTADRYACKQGNAPQSAYRVNAHQAVETILYQTYPKVFNNSAWGKIYRRDVIGEERFTPGLYFEDIDFFHRVFLKCDIVGVTHATVYFYRQIPTSILHTFSFKRTDVLKITERLEDTFRHDTKLFAAAKDRRLSANFNIFLLLALCSDSNNYRSVTDECWKLIKRYRLSSLLNRKSRWKNKIGALLSYGGKNMFLRLHKINNRCC